MVRLRRQQTLEADTPPVCVLTPTKKPAARFQQVDPNIAGGEMSIDLTSKRIASNGVEWPSFMDQIVPANDCWMWTGRTNTKGYGQTTYQGRSVQAHRLFYETRNGPIPKGLEIDHLCRVRDCVNPDHLEAVTHAENVRRGAAAKTHCINGHPYTEDNIYIDKGSGARRCQICVRETWNNYHRNKWWKDA